MRWIVSFGRSGLLGRYLSEVYVFWLSIDRSIVIIITEKLI